MTHRDTPELPGEIWEHLLDDDWTINALVATPGRKGALLRKHRVFLVVEVEDVEPDKYRRFDKRLVKSKSGHTLTVSIWERIVMLLRGSVSKSDADEEQLSLL